MTKPKILLADDEADIVDSIRFSLEPEGYEVFTAADGAEALQRARELQPDLIVLDVQMPRENGYRVSKILREDRQAGRIAKDIRIILLTARNLSSDPEREKMFIDFSHADVMMYKPFEMDELVAKIHGLLGR